MRSNTCTLCISFPIMTFVVFNSSVSEVVLAMIWDLVDIMMELCWRHISVYNHEHLKRYTNTKMDQASRVVKWIIFPYNKFLLAYPGISPWPGVKVLIGKLAFPFSFLSTGFMILPIASRVSTGIWFLSKNSSDKEVFTLSIRSSDEPPWNLAIGI